MDYIYLDNAATSFPKPTCVIEAVNDFLCHIGSSPARSAHSLSIQSGKILYEARLALAELLSQPNEERVIFTPNATFAINAVLYGLLQKGDKVLTTSLEHNSVLRPLENLKSKNIDVCILKANEYGEIDLQVARNIMSHAKVFICTQVSNVCGVQLPIEALKAICAETRTIFVLDVSQAVGYTHVNATSADILCGSCHKGLYAPSALGFISLNPHFNIDLLDSFIQGGSGSYSKESRHPQILPDKYEAGTPNMCAIAGLKAALEWIKQKDLETIFAHCSTLRQHLLKGLQNLAHIELYAIDRLEYTNKLHNTSSPIGALAFNIKGKSPSSVGLWLDKTHKILTRVGLHCAPLTHKSLGSFSRGGSVRVSFGAFNTLQDIDKLLFALRES